MRRSTVYLFFLPKTVLDLFFCKQNRLLLRVLFGAFVGLLRSMKQSFVHKRCTNDKSW